MPFAARLLSGAALAALCFAAAPSPSALAQDSEADTMETIDTASAPASEDQVSQTPVADAEAAKDPFLWLEEVEGERALDWVREQNERTLEILTSDPRYKGFEAAAVDALTSDERIPYVSVRDSQAYNFWQDTENVRGLWRRTSLDSYRSDKTEWETLLDFDALAEEEGKNWVFKGANCHVAERADTGADPRQVCLLSLSDGGKDAVVLREFDPIGKTFIQDGFTAPEAKQSASWIDADNVLISTDWGQDGSTLTESGYPSDIRVWTRGTPLSEAEPFFSGDKSDVGVWPFVLELDDGTRLPGAVESDTFFTQTYYLQRPGESAPTALDLPGRVDISEQRAGFLFLRLREDWSPEGTNEDFKSGDVVAMDLQAFLDSGETTGLELVFRPGDRQTVTGLSRSGSQLLMTLSDNVVNRVAVLEDDESGWSLRDIALPGKGNASLAFADKDEEEVLIGYEGFLTPDSLLEADLEAGETTPLKSLPVKFDTEGLSVSQLEATSADGTKVPYFVIHKDGLDAGEGDAPTLLYGYGGFEVSLNPSYSPVLGRLWLEQGGTYVLANIRGGGEFGPSWHQAGLKQNRQRIYDDFIAVAEDLVERDVTTPEKLGIMGGSNGGLLMGVMLNQRPDLWDAVVVQVPLLDMLRYHTLLAGASWVDEYGSPEVPEEREFLEKISPYQNFDADKDYPTPFFVTSTKDDRVHPGHARKLAAKFEAANKPFLYYENIDGGHSAAANQMERAKRSALEYTYLARQLMGMPGDEGEGDENGGGSGED